MVLAMSGLLMTVVVAVLLLGRSETRSARAFSDAASVRSLADLPVNVTMAQIRKATAGLDIDKTWTSQPGMIRVFGTDPGLGNRSKLVHAYKLYSSDVMVTGEEFSPDKEASSLADWSSSAALFTDLNEPVTVTSSAGGGTKAYPILDPAAFAGTSGTSAIAGCKMTAAPGASAGHAAPMPVRWLYVLQDGRIVAPTGGSGTRATFDSGQVTAQNPIVGRIAFWADDESCKVNVNTASEGTPWDVPRTTGWADHNYASFVPGQNEFQRFPGHPAMTCLSPVLGAFDSAYEWRGPFLKNDGTVDPSQMDSDKGVVPGKYSDFLKGIYELLPRTNFGEKAGEDGAKYNETTRGGTQAVTSLTGAPVKRERLFASVDEFFFDSSRQQAGGSHPISARDLDIGRFFLTAHSRAPETNLFNRPRICLWPLSESKSSTRTGKDKLISFCSTVAGRECAWHRSSFWQDSKKPGSSQSPDEDFTLASNQRVFSYLESVTKRRVPGFGGATFDDKYGALNRNQILLQMFDLDRWAVNAWCANSDPSTGKLDPASSYYYLPPRSYTGKNSTYIGEAGAVPVVASSVPDQTKLPDPSHALKAAGRFPTVTEACVVFMATEVEATDGSALGPNDTGKTPLDKENNLTHKSGSDSWADKTRKMRACIVLAPFTPVVGMPPYTANVRYRIKGLEKWTINGKAMFRSDISSTNVNRAWRPAGAASENAHQTAYTGLHATLMNGSGGNKTMGGKDEDQRYPFYGEEIDVAGKDTFEFPGTTAQTITIEIFSGFGNTPTAGASPLQTIEMEFPNTTVRVPKLWQKQITQMNFDNRLINVRSNLILEGDVARSVIVDTNGPSKGDYRHIASLAFVPKAYFKEHPFYKSDPSSTITNDFTKPTTSFWDEAQTLRYAANTYQCHYGRIWAQAGLSISGGQEHTWQACGYEIDGTTKTVTKPYGLVKDVAYWQDFQPACTYKLDGAMNLDSKPGDWDTGTGRIEDGPYLNKPDEGGQDYSSDSYYGRGGFIQETGKSYSPNRQICSAAGFGSVPSGVHPSPGESKPRPWQTLLFCPNPPSRATAATAEPTKDDHFGFGQPRDHLLLDLFWMPVVDPYAISEPFSTAGKINMNHQIMPFTYIERTTGLHAALRSVRISALPAALAWPADASTTGANSSQKQEAYKAWLSTMTNSADNLKFDTNYQVNVDETLKGLKQRFSQGDVFHSPSEICDVFLVPKPITGHTYISQNKRTKKSLSKPSQSPGYAEMTSWWNGNATDPDDGFKLTGDNVRESPYNQLYPRLTTRSNVFQVHYRVQTLKKARSTNAAEWDDATDQISAEYRGSSVVERYLDPNDSSVPDFLSSPVQAGALDDWYRFRVIRKKQFAP